MTTPSNVQSRDTHLELIEALAGLSVDLHNLNASVQRHFDISIVQWVILKKIIDRPGLSAGTLADISGIHPSTLTPTMTRLESMGLIYIQERPTDLRRKFIIASWKGFQFRRSTEHALARSISKDLGDLDTRKIDLEQTRALTKRLISNIHNSVTVVRKNGHSLERI